MSPNKEQWTASDEFIYNIGVVARMTGIPVATLRVWERRYKFPRSARTAGGHRLYSEKELLRLRWVKANIDEGMQTSQAIRALRSREKGGRIPELLPVTAPVRPPLQPAAEGIALGAFQQRLTKALLSHDLAAADQLLGEILAIYPMEQLVLEVIGPTLNDIGEGWLAGQVNVATEHLASQFLRQRLMMWLVIGPPTHPIRPIVLACAPGEWHEVSLLMLGVLLRRRRWPVAYLGQSLPLPDLAKFVREMRPPAVVLVAMTEQPARELRELAQWLPEVSQGGHPVIAYGGYIFNTQPELREGLQGTFLGSTLPEGVNTLERLLREATALTV